MHIENANFNADRFVPILSRYIDSTVIYYGDRKLLTFTTYKRKPRLTSSNDKFMIVTKGVEYRPDLVSFDSYGTCDLWWKILEASGMNDIYDFKAGAQIIIPDSIF